MVVIGKYNFKIITMEAVYNLNSFIQIGIKIVLQQIDFIDIGFEYNVLFLELI